MNGSGELVSGAIAAVAPGEVARRIETLGPRAGRQRHAGRRPRRRRRLSACSTSREPKTSRSSPAISRCCCAPARAINDGLELLAADRDFGRLRPVVAEIRSHVLAGESFAERCRGIRDLFPPMYVALVRVGEASGSLDQVLEVLADERSRAEALRRKARRGDPLSGCSCSAPPAAC